METNVETPLSMSMFNHGATLTKRIASGTTVMSALMVRYVVFRRFALQLKKEKKKGSNNKQAGIVENIVIV